MFYISILPPEITDFIFSFCEGHVRADLRIKVRVPVRQPIPGLVDKLLLDYNYTYDYDGKHYICFINKLNTDHQAGYVAKIVAKNNVSYTWIQTNWF